MQNRKIELHIWIEGTIAAAMAMVLSLIPTSIGSSFSVSLGMIPMVLYSLRRGAKAGVFSAFIWGLLHFPLGQVYFLTPFQVVIEYLLAFGFTGFAGLFSSQLKTTIQAGNAKKSRRIIFVATFTGTVARYFWHFIAGVIFWGSFALWGMNPWLFSFLMNGLSGVATAIVTATVLVIVLKIAPQLFVPSYQIFRKQPKS